MAHPLKVAGEVQMKALSHDMGLLRQTNERLLAQNRELADMLRKVTQGRHGEHVHPSLDLVHEARALLAKVKS